MSTAPAAHCFDLDAIGAGLPVASARTELEAAAHSGAMVVTAPPGTGKTTLVPPLVANLAEQGIVVRAGTPLGGPGHIRVSYGAAEQNRRFLAALADAI